MCTATRRPAVRPTTTQMHATTNNIEGLEVGLAAETGELIRYSFSRILKLCGGVELRHIAELTIAKFKQLIDVLGLQIRVMVLETSMNA